MKKKPRRCNTASVEMMAATMLPELLRNRYNYGMGTSGHSEFVSMAVQLAREIKREARK